MSKKAIGIIAVYSIEFIAILWIFGYFIYSNTEGRQDKKLEYEELAAKEIENKEAEHEEIKQSINEGAIETDNLSTYTIISTLDYKNNWVQGKIDNSKKIVTSEDAYLSLNHYIPIESSNYKVLVNYKSYRMIVNKYNQNNKFIGYVDLCNGDILYISDTVKYITISIYKYKERQRLKHGNQGILKDLKNGLEFSISKIDDLEGHIMDKELLTAEVHIETLSNYYNYRTGWFMSWGGKYENVEGSICARNLYEIDDKPYIFNVNDSRIALSINEYDKNGVWVKYNEALINGDTFIKQPTTSYIGISIWSRNWGVDLYALFESGLKIDLASEQYMDNTGSIDFDKADFSKADHWKTGSYLYETGERIINSNAICYDSFCKIGDKEYVVNLPSGYLKMSIIELDQDGKAVLDNRLQSGEKWKKSKDTHKIAISVYGDNKSFTVADYKRFLAEDLTIGLKEYVRYTHNTKMKDITAGEFINRVNVGWNLGNSLDCWAEGRSKSDNLKQETYWGNPYITEDLIDYVAKCGFNTIRIPVTWYYNTYKDENEKLKISKEWLYRVQNVVDYAIANDLYVILNTHHEQSIIYAGSDDKALKKVLENAQLIWTEIAESFKTYDEHLIFESYNEVDNIELNWNYSDKAAVQMNELNQIFVDTVRSTGGNNTNRILVVPTLLDGADSRFYAAFRMPKDIITDKIVVQVHTYSEKFNQDIESDFTELEEFSKRIKAPIIIGEFGTTKMYPLTELRAEQASNFVARAAGHGIKCIWWDDGADYGIIDRRDFSNSNMEMINALLEGTQGIGSQIEREVILNKAEQFVYRIPNLDTGELEYTYWGMLTTDIEGSAIQVQEGTTCSVSLKTINEASGIWLNELFFYDAEGALVKAGEKLQWHSGYYIGTVPEHSVTMRVSITNPDINIPLEDFEKYLSNGEIEVGICFFNLHDVKKIKLNITQFR